MFSALPLLNRTILAVMAVCLLLAGCADAPRSVASKDQAALSSSTTKSSTSTVSSTTTPPATSTSSTSTLPSETPTAEDIFAERASQLARDESAPEDPDIQLIKFLLTMFPPAAHNSSAPEWLTQQQITQLSDEIDTLSVDLSSEIDELLLKYVETVDICGDDIETEIALSECAQEFIEVCNNFTILQAQLDESQEIYFNSLWYDIRQIICYTSDSLKFLDYAQEASERCSGIWSTEDFGEIFPIEFSRHQTDFPLSYIIPIQGESDQFLESLEECKDEYDNFCSEMTNLQTRFSNFPTWYIENDINSEADEFLNDASVVENTTTLICQLAEMVRDIVDFTKENLSFLDTCQDVNPFVDENSDEPSLVKSNMQNKGTVLLVQSTTDEELIEKCFEIIQSICFNIKSLITKMKEATEIDEEFEELAEMYSSLETIYCGLADIFSQE